MPDRKKEFDRLLELIENANASLIDQLLRKLEMTGNVGHILSSRVTLNKLGKKSCQPALLWVMGGNGKTDSDGQQQIHLNKLLCETEDIDNSTRLVFTGEPRFVTTAESNEPAFLTAISEITETPVQAFEVSLEGQTPTQTLDIIVNVRSWDNNGNALPHVNYQWNCLVEGARLINYFG